MDIHKLLLSLVLLWSYHLSAQSTQMAIDTYSAFIANDQYSPSIKLHVLDSIRARPEDTYNGQLLSQAYYTLLKKTYRDHIDIALECAHRIEHIGNTINSDKDFYKKNDKNIVNLYYKNGDYHNVIKYGKRYLEKHPEETSAQAIVYRVLGNAYSDLGDFIKAIAHYNKAIFIFKNLKEFNEEGRTLINLLDAYQKTHSKLSFNQVFKATERLDSIHTYQGLSRTDVMKKELNTGALYDAFKVFDKAQKHYQVALLIAQELSDSVFIHKALVDLGILYRKQKELDASIKTFEKAISYNSSRASVYNNMADTYRDKEDYKKALKFYHLALQDFLHIDNNDLFHLPDRITLEEVNNKVELFGYLRDKANVLLLLNDNTLEDAYLKLALDLYTLADEVIDDIYFESREQVSKYVWREEASSFYLKATEAAHQRSDLKKSFYFIEKSKALMILEDMTDNHAKALANLPAQIKAREFKLVSEVQRTKEELQQYYSKGNNQRFIDSLRNHIFYMKQQYARFIDSLETRFPIYYNLKRKITIASLSEVQKSLLDDELLFQYVLGKDKGFLIVVSNTETYQYRLENVNKLEVLVHQFLDMIKTPFVTPQDSEQFQKVAFQIYQVLFPCIQKDIDIINNKKLTIVPDGLLQYVPFEALVKNPTSPLEDSYLLNFCDVHYAYSYTSLNLKRKVQFKKNFFAIQPTIFKDTSLSSFERTPQYASRLKKIINTEVVSGRQASKGHFLREFGRSKVVHISTHGGVSDGHPWISFYDKKLKVSDMFFKTEKSDLVVLSACKTSQGEMKRGEGVLSIARAFIGSGTGSVLASLWDINEKATQELTLGFYNSLKQGNTKSKALKNAKITYLDKHRNTSEASPFYWSSLILTGSNEAIFDHTHTLSTINIFFLIILGVFLLIAIAFIIREKRVPFKVTIG